MNFIMFQAAVLGLVSTAQASGESAPGFSSGLGYFFSRVEDKKLVGKPYFINVVFPKKLADIQDNNVPEFGLYDPSGLMEGSVAGFDRISTSGVSGDYFFYGSIPLHDTPPVMKVSDGRVPKSNGQDSVRIVLRYEAGLLSHGQLFQGLCSYVEDGRVADAMSHQQFWQGGEGNR